MLVFVSTQFQFHNGTIKSGRHNGDRRGRADFNSTMVRLKDEVHGLLVDGESYFNSTMVRLKAEPLKLAKLMRELFQFHNGTIKRFRIKTLSLHKWKFQFHNGTIKRKTISIRKSAEDYFNSTMVRLKLSVLI